MIEEKISIMTGSKIQLHGAGRTDAGVHALGMVANFPTNSTIPVLGFHDGLNSLLPEDIRIFGVEDVDPAFHARNSAKGKVYSYNITTIPVPLPTERLYYTHVRGPLDIRAMRDCLDHIVGSHDFSSFEATGSRDSKNKKGKGALRTIFSAELMAHHQSIESFRVVISGDGFLRHMVRNIVGTLIEAGQGKRTAQSFNEVLAAKDRKMAGPTAPSKGLFLEKVLY